MNPERYAQLQELFDAALELEGQARRAYLDGACAGDAELRAGVEKLLDQEEGGHGAALESAAGLGQELLAEAAPPAAQPAAVPAPERVGRYLVLRVLAEGGMGTVYLAEQDSPHRQVALKLIRAGAISDELRRRFQFEAQILGRLQHPGIAQVHEAGEVRTPQGEQPYIAMEYVDGEDLMRFVETRELGPRARLELLVEVCDAVSHAHQKGVVHRDLKPANILVVEESTSASGSGTGGARLRGRPKVLDFGVSRLVEEGPLETTRLTRTGHVVGTLAYMSPEQAAGEPSVDTRSDVYSLGVIAYRLLCGRLPHDLSEQRLMRALQTVQQKPAPRLESLDGRFRGDLSIIVGKALELEPERRYGSAAALADDLRRYLEDQPITARPPTLRYQLGRFVRRNRALVIAASVALFCLVAGLVLALRSQREEARQRVVAEARTGEARRSAYAAQLQAASAHRISGDDEAARGLLARTDPELRGWEWEHLSAELDHDLQRLPMTILERPWWGTAPGDSRLLFAVDEQTLRLFDLATSTWRDLPCDRPGRPPATSLALLPGREEFLLGDERGNLELLDLDGAREPRRVWSSGGHINAILSLPDGRHAVTASWLLESADPGSAALHVLDLETFEVRAQRGGLHRIYGLELSPDGRYLAVPTGSGAIEVLALPGLEPIQTLRGHEGEALRVCFSAGGRQLASSGVDRTVRVWSLDTGDELHRFGLARTPSWALAFHPDGETLLSGHGDALVRVWDLASGNCEVLSTGVSDGEQNARAIWKLWIPEGGERVFAVGLDGVYERSLRAPVPDALPHEKRMYAFVYDVEFSHGGRRLTSAGWDGFARIWDVATGRAVAALDSPNFACWVRYSPDEEHLLVSAEVGWTTHVLRSWEASTLVEERELSYTARRPCGLFLPDGAFLLATDPDFDHERGAEAARHVLWVLDPESLELRQELPVPAEVWALALDPSATRLAYGMSDGQLGILDAISLAPLHELRAHAGAIEALAWSPDGLRLASGGADSEVAVWDADTTQELLRFETPGARDLMALLFTPDGRRILTGSRRVSIGIWDASSGLELLRLAGHEDYVHDLALSPDGRLLASASGDGTVRLWDTRSLRDRSVARAEALRLELALSERVQALMVELGGSAGVLGVLEDLPELSEDERYAVRNLLQESILRQ